MVDAPEPIAPATDGWWYVEGENRSGPLSSEQIEELLRAGTVKLTTMVWRDGRLTWMPLYQVPELARGRAAPEFAHEPPFLRTARESERPVGIALWVAAVVLGVALGDEMQY